MVAEPAAQVSLAPSRGLFEDPGASSTKRVRLHGGRGKHSVARSLFFSIYIFSVEGLLPACLVSGDAAAGGFALSLSGALRSPPCGGPSESRRAGSGRSRRLAFHASESEPDVAPAARDLERPRACYGGASRSVSNHRCHAAPRAGAQHSGSPRDDPRDYSRHRPSWSCVCVCVFFLLLLSVSLLEEIPGQRILVGGKRGVSPDFLSPARRPPAVPRNRCSTFSTSPSTARTSEGRETLRAWVLLAFLEACVGGGKGGGSRCQRRVHQFRSGARRWPSLCPPQWRLGCAMVTPEPHAIAPEA